MENYRVVHIRVHNEKFETYTSYVGTKNECEKFLVGLKAEYVFNGLKTNDDEIFDRPVNGFIVYNKKFDNTIEYLIQKY